MGRNETSAKPTGDPREGPFRMQARPSMGQEAQGMEWELMQGWRQGSDLGGDSRGQGSAGPLHHQP